MQKIADYCSFIRRKKTKSVLLKMKLTLILIFAGTLALSATSYSQKTKLTLNLQETTSLNDIFKVIEKNTEFIFIYDANAINTEIKKSVVAQDERIEPVLDKLFAGTGINYRIYDRQIVLFNKDKPESSLPLAFKLNVSEPQQTRVITGTVSDSKGAPVIGATIKVKGTTTGTTTNVEGKFQLNVPVNNQVLLISYIGMIPKEIDATGKASIEVQMLDQTINIDEVVVVGYGTQKKMTVTGAVSAVSSAQLLQTPVAQISTALVGKSPGLIMVQRTGEPGSDQNTIRIRGVSTFSGSSDPLIMIDGVEAQSFNNLDPNEIENIAVLKDASSTALYGVRGANGVLLISTKRGKLGRPQISYSSNFAIDKFIDYKNFVHAYDYAWGWNEGLKYDTYYTGSAYVPRFSQADLDHYQNHDDPIFHPDVDWMKFLLKDQSYQTQNNLNIRGGTENVKYFVSLGMFTQGGLFNNTHLIKDYYDIQVNYKRYNFRSNFDFKITKRLSASVNVTSTIENKTGLNSDESIGATGIIRLASIANPIATPGIIDGKIIQMQNTTLGTQNPIRDMYWAGYSRRYKNYLTGLVRFNYDLDFITKGLSSHVSVSYQNYNTQNIISYKGFPTYTAIQQADGSALFVPGSDGPFTFSEQTGKRRYTYLEAGLDYSRTFGNHTVGATLLYNQSKLFDPGLANLIPSGVQGIAGRVNYNFKGRYLAEFDMGYNGTENFAPGKRFGFFPAYSVGWVISEEPFFPKNKIVTFTKLRGSYGEVGNDKIGGTRFLYNPSSYGYVSNSYYFGLVGTSSFGYQGTLEGKIGNPDLTWERTKKTDIGIEINLFKDRIKIIADYFYVKTENILTTPNTIPFIAGIGGNIPALNIGKMDNKGIDGEITYNGKVSSFNYWIRANYTYAHNTILFRDEVYNPAAWLYATGQMNGQTFGSVDEGLYNTWEEVSDWYKPKTSFQNNRIQPGDQKHKDINGDGVIDTYDRAPIGYSDFPEISYGFSFGGDYKGFDFNVLFQGAANVTFQAAGNYVNPYNGTAQAMTYTKDGAWTYEKYLNGDKNIYWPRYVYTANQNSYGLRGDFFYCDAKYLRLRNAELGYTITKNSLLSRVGISSFRIYCNGSNLLTFINKRMRSQYPGVDPENTGTFNGSGNNEPYPRTKVYNFGINVNF